MTRSFSPMVKFVAITIDEIFIVLLAIVVVLFWAPEYLLLTVIIAVPGTALFVIVKYYLVYPSLVDTGSYGLYDLKGMTGVVTETVTSKSGKIRVGGEIWDARCGDGQILPGSQVQILSRESLRVLVSPLES